MKGSVTIGKIAGIPIRLHWSLIFLVLFAIGPGITWSKALSELAWIVVIFACVVVHELAHCLLARHRGHKVRGVVLMPLGGFSEIVGLDRSPADEAAVSLIGPFMNCGIAAVLTVVAAAVGLRIWPPTLFGRAWLVRVMWANVALAGLNLLPALPLDGGRALRGLLSRRRDRADASEIAARLATGVGVLMIVVGVMADLWLALVGFLVIVSSSAEQRMAMTGELLRGMKVKDAMVEDSWGLQANEPVADATSLLRQFPNRAFAVVDSGTGIGIVSASDLAAHPHASTIRDLVDTFTPSLTPDDDLYPTALDAFAESGRKSLLVEVGGHPAGVLYASDVEVRVRERALGGRGNRPLP